MTLATAEAVELETKNASTQSVIAVRNEARRRFIKVFGRIGSSRLGDAETMPLARILARKKVRNHVAIL